MVMRALRGAITVDEDSPEQVSRHTQTLLKAVFDRNGISSDDVVSVLFTATGDISMPPAAAAREVGMTDVPLLCAQEMEASVGPPLCIRLMMHVDVDRPRHEMRHVFLRGATVLRPDLVEPGDAEV